MVHTGPGKPGKSWNFNIPKSRPGNAGKSILVMESHGKLKFYITLTKYFTYFNSRVITIILEGTIARQVLPYDQSHMGIDYTNKRHLFKLPYTHCIKEFILFKKVLKLQHAIITRYCKVYFGILYYFIQCQ